MRKIFLSLVAGLIIAASLSFDGIVAKAEENVCYADVSTSATYNDGQIAFTYNPTYFTKYVDSKTGDVTLSFYNEDVQTAGADVIIFSTVAHTDAKSALKTLGASEKEIRSSSFGSLNSDVTVYSYTATALASSESGLQVIDTYFAIQDDEHVILIDVMYTVEPDEETATLISDQISMVLDSLALCE